MKEGNQNMQITIERLNNQREKLISQKSASNKRYSKKITRINKALRKFNQAIAVLGEKKNATAEIEDILSDGKSRHINEIAKELKKRGIDLAYQSISGIMQIYSKKYLKYEKTAPATFKLISNKPNAEEKN